MFTRKVGDLSRNLIIMMQMSSFWILKHNRQKFKAYLLKDSKTIRLLASCLPSLLVIKAASKKDTKETSEKVIKVADNLYNDARYEELYFALNEHHDSSEPEILWRVARSIFEKCRDLTDVKIRLEHYENALQLVQKAIDINEECWAAHKWYAILLDYVWRNKSTKGRIIHSFDMKKHMERAVELNPSDSTTWYLLGEWCYSFADMPWYQRNVAAAIFATPPTSTYEEALQFFDKAEKIQPSFYSMNLLMLGKCYLKIKNTDKAILYLQQARDYPVKTPDDKKAHEEAEKLLKGLKA